LTALRDAAFVKTHERSDFEDTTEHQFDHHLLHQVTYDTLLKSERKRGHGAAARWLAERTQGRGAEFLAMTGEHAERAGNLALAIDCFEQAGNEAKQRHATAAAVAWLRRALALLGATEPMRRCDLLFTLGVVADMQGDRSTEETLYQEIADLLAQHPDDTRHARLYSFRALLADRCGDSARSEELARQGFELAERCAAAEWAAMTQGQLAYLHYARQDPAVGGQHIETGLHWAGKIEDDKRRAATEAKLLTVSAMLSIYQVHYGPAREALQSVLALGETLKSPRLQLGALANLAVVASCLGRWDDMAAWGERMRALAHAIGSPVSVADSQFRLAEAGEGRGDLRLSMGLLEHNLAIHRSTGGRDRQAITLRYLASLHLAQGDAQAALRSCEQAEELHRALKDPLEACRVGALRALSETRLGQAPSAAHNLNQTLARLHQDLGHCAAHETLSLRWDCQQALQALADERAAPALEQLFADVLACAAERTDADDRERLIQALPLFRAIVAAHAGPHPLDSRA
jgi:tetratricopeptide (TPR) repeat protein